MYFLPSPDTPTLPSPPPPLSLPPGLTQKGPGTDFLPLMLRVAPSRTHLSWALRLWPQQLRKIIRADLTPCQLYLGYHLGFPDFWRSWGS